MKLQTDLPMDPQAFSIRNITCEVNVLTQPDGSASYNQGDSCSLVAVYGPAEVKVSKEHIDKATVDVIYKPKVGLPGCEDKFLERIIRNTCETVILTALHPRTLITIVIQEMHNSGSYLACCINAACLALLDSGVPMKYTTAAVSCMLDKDSDALIVDPSKKQENNARAQCTFAFDSIDKNIVSSSTNGQFNVSEYQKCLNVCREACGRIFEFYKETMKKKLEKSVM